MIAETLILKPEEGSMAVLAGPDNTIQLSFRYGATVIGKHLSQDQARELAQMLNQALAEFGQAAESKAPR